MESFLYNKSEVQSLTDIVRIELCSIRNLEELFYELSKQTGSRISDWDDLEELQIIQKHQYTRKTTMKAKILGYNLCGRKVPVYDRKLLKEYAKNASFKQKTKLFLGTVKRIVQGKI